jgi:Flp pilus assembly protein TadG
LDREPQEIWLRGGIYHALMMVAFCTRFISTGILHYRLFHAHRLRLCPVFNLIAMVVMRIQELYSRLRRTLSRFASAHHGNVVITFSLLTLPLIVGVGAAVDYNRATSIKAAMQAALDSTALMLAKNAGSLTAAQLQTEGSKYFLAVFRRHEAKNPKITVVSNVGNSTVQVSGSSIMDTSLMALMGIKTVNITGSSTAAWATASYLRVALVLDNTGSMADAGKMPALQTAAKNLLSKLASAATANGEVYVSIVPFVKDVNLGAANYNSSYLDWTAWDETKGTCSSSSYTTKTTCVAAGKSWTPVSHSSWNGCVVDRGDAAAPNSGNYDANTVLPSTSVAATLYVPEQYSSCPQGAMGLSYNWSGMTTLINNMSPAGNTNQAIGLQLGWMSLMQGGVFNAPAKESGVTYAEHIILVTDGLNTEDRWYSNQASIDARQQILCDNIKATGATVWAIQVNTGGDPTSTLLQNCASDPSKFFLLTTANQIISTFDNISFKITQLHLAN